MRRLVDLIAVLAVLTVASVIYAKFTQKERLEKEVNFTAGELRRFETELKVRSATGGTELNGRGWPVMVAPEWFGASPPQNTLLPEVHPWVEIAPVEEAEELHPRVRVAEHPVIAAFWYNPYTGVVRARVPAQLSDKATLDLYNQVNASKLDSLFASATGVAKP